MITINSVVPARWWRPSRRLDVTSNTTFVATLFRS